MMEMYEIYYFLLRVIRGGFVA